MGAFFMSIQPPVDGEGFPPLPLPEIKKGFTMCEHKNIVRLQSGWFCPDCGQAFDKKPEKTAEKPKKAKPKGKKEA